MKAKNMVRIKMLRNKSGSPDGIKVHHYEKDTEHDVPESLAKTFVEDDKVAERLVGENGEDVEAAAKAAEAKAAEKAAKAEAAAKAKAEKAEKAAKDKAEKALKNKAA